MNNIYGSERHMQNGKNFGSFVEVKTQIMKRGTKCKPAFFQGRDYFWKLKTVDATANHELVAINPCFGDNSAIAAWNRVLWNCLLTTEAHSKQSRKRVQHSLSRENNFQPLCLFAGLIFGHVRWMVAQA